AELLNRNYVFISKLSPDGSRLIYSAIIGGTRAVPDSSPLSRTSYLDNFGTGIAVDEEGSAYVVGSTVSQNFPTTPGAIAVSYNPEPGAGEAAPKYAGFALKLSAAGY